MSITTTTAPTTETTAAPTAPAVRTVSCDAPGCTESAPLAESGHLPAGWHTLEKALGAAVDAPHWHYCLAHAAQMLAALGHVAQTVERQFIGEDHEAEPATAPASEPAVSAEPAVADAESATTESETEAEPAEAPAES